MSFFKLCFAVVILSLLPLAGAQAHMVVFEDDMHNISFSYPDTWRRVSKQKPDELIRIVAPANGASCALKMREDHRFSVYSDHHRGALQRQNFAGNFWADYVGIYDNPAVQMINNVGMGRGFGSFALAAYTTPGPINEARSSAMLVSTYQNEVAILDCSTRTDQYSAYHPVFMTIAKSVNHRQTSYDWIYGYYRNFTKDKPLIINNGSVKKRPIDSGHFVY